MRQRFSLVALGLACALAGEACGDSSNASGTGSAPETSSSPATASTATETRRTMPYLEIDKKGPSIGIDHLDLTKPEDQKKYRDLLSQLPVEGPQTVIVTRDAKIADVASLVWELGQAGAPVVTVKTDGRGDLPKELPLVPEGRVEKPDKCSIVATVLEDLSTAVWAFDGGTAKRHRKGLAGPDLSHTHETLVKDLAQCASKTAFFSAAAKLTWEQAFNIGGAIRKADEKKQIEKLVLVGDEPVAGRPVKLQTP